jgi:hypothetical protein
MTSIGIALFREVHIRELTREAEREGVAVNATKGSVWPSARVGPAVPGALQDNASDYPSRIT